MDNIGHTTICHINKIQATMKKKKVKKVNLEYLPLNCLNGSIDYVDIRESLANTLFNQAYKIPEKRLAEKLYDSKGEVELNEEECLILEAFINREDIGFLIRIKDAIINSITNKQE